MSKQVSLKELEKKLRNWRSSGRKGGIPKEIWEMVSALPVEHSVTEITKRLSLEWHKVKRLRSAVSKEEGVSEFIEVKESFPVHSGIIIERADGDRMIISIAEDVGRLIEAFLGAGK